MRDAEVLEQLCARPHRHRDELVGEVRGVLCVDDLGQQEVGEGARLGEAAAGRQRRTEHGHRLGPGHGHAGRVNEGHSVICSFVTRRPKFSDYRIVCDFLLNLAIIPSSNYKYFFSLNY